jgi:hypothetical protein
MQTDDDVVQQYPMDDDSYGDGDEGEKRKSAVCCSMAKPSPCGSKRFDSIRGVVSSKTPL